MTIKPMLAVPMHKGTITDWQDWAVEEKHDGHRLIIHVTHTGHGVLAYTRPRNRARFPGKEMAERALPRHLELELGQLPHGVYDGELLGGDTSTDVTRVDLRGALRIVLFDVPSASGTYDQRRKALKDAVAYRRLQHVDVTGSFVPKDHDDVRAYVAKVWARGGEGAILKRRASTYQPGKRSPDWIKVKKCQHAALTVVGFEPSRGTVRFPGHPFAIVVLEDDKGVRTTVKTKDDAELAAFTRQANGGTVEQHPALGRRLVIEFQDRTRTGEYRHPRWDRWEDE